MESLAESFIERLNVNSVFLVPLIFKHENEAAGLWVSPTSDPAANLHPAKPKDFLAFINLVEFCRYLKNAICSRVEIINYWL